MINKLVKLADYLDAAGSKSHSDKIDHMIKKLADYEGNPWAGGGSSAGRSAGELNSDKVIIDAAKKRKRDKPLESWLRKAFPFFYKKDPKDEEIEALKKKIEELERASTQSNKDKSFFVIYPFMEGKWQGGNDQWQTQYRNWIQNAIEKAGGKLGSLEKLSAMYPEIYDIIINLNFGDIQQMGKALRDICQKHNYPIVIVESMFQSKNVTYRGKRDVYVEYSVNLKSIKCDNYEMKDFDHAKAIGRLADSKTKDEFMKEVGNAARRMLN